MLKLIGTIVMVGMMHGLQAQVAPGDQQFPSKEKVSKNLIMLRDSINATVAKLQQREVHATDPLRPAYQKFTQDLTRYKIQLEKAIEVVVSTEWTTDVRTRTSQTIDDVRREYKRIQSELKEEQPPE